MPIFQCPHCEEEITSLGCSLPTYENGYERLHFSNGHVQAYDFEHEDYSDSYGDAEYRCPECGDDLNSDEVVVTGEDSGDSVEVPRMARNMIANFLQTAGGVTDLNSFDFCSGCRDLKEKKDLLQGKCEACRNE
jgi:hypothetical protein